MKGAPKDLGFSVRIFMPAGDAAGLHIFEKSNWIGEGLLFPRSLFSRIRQLPGFDRVAVYILWGPGESEHIPLAYVGETDNLGRRLNDHVKAEDYWTHAVALTSKDSNLNKAHVRYLEARLYDIAREAKRCKLQNKNIPTLPSLSHADAADAELFLKDTLFCLPAVGIGFFDSPSEATSSTVNLYLKRKYVSAKGYEAPSGFVVVSGSQAVNQVVPSMPPSSKKLREELIEQEVMVTDGEVYRFTQDYRFASPSAASDVVLGGSTSGLQSWRDVEGRSLKDLQLGNPEEV